MSAASPDMAAPELQALRDSIAAIGQLVPILLYRGKVIDGRKRLLVCQQLGREPTTVTIPDDASGVDHATALNLFRTHYTVGQRTMYATTLANLDNGTNQHRRKVGDQIRSPTQGADIPDAPMSATDAAATVGVRRNDITAGRRIRKEGAPEVASAVERGDLSLDAGYKIATTTPKVEQAALVARVVAAKGKAKKLPPGTIKPRTFKALPRRDATVVVTRCLRNLEATCEVLEQYGAKELPTTSHKEWIKSLETITATLRRFRRRLSGEGNGHAS